MFFFLELAKYCSGFTRKYKNDNTVKCYSNQYIERKIQKVEQNFNPGLALIGLSGTGPWSFESGIQLKDSGSH